MLLFLAKIVFSGAMEVNTVYQSDTTPTSIYADVPLERQILNLYDTYTDQKARDADSLNPITNHLTELSNELIIELKNYINYVTTQENNLKLFETQKDNLRNFFTDKIEVNDNSKDTRQGLSVLY